MIQKVCLGTSQENPCLAIPEALLILDKLAEELRKLEQPDYDRIHVVLPDYESPEILIELYGGPKRVGFVCDPVPADSSWFRVHADSVNCTFDSDSGPMENANYSELLHFMLG